jgi:hypothetical protein
VPALESVDGVSKVDLSGAAQERLVVKLDPPSWPRTTSRSSQIQGVLPPTT